MTVVVDFSGTQASISAGKWSCSWGDLRDALQGLEDTREDEGYDPDPDYTGAQYAIEALKDGKITSADPPSAEAATEEVW